VHSACPLLSGVVHEIADVVAAAVIPVSDPLHIFKTTDVAITIRDVAAKARHGSNVVNGFRGNEVEFCVLHYLLPDEGKMLISRPVYLAKTVCY